jgi:ABC-2 type transport system ATP-binding protein
VAVANDLNARALEHIEGHLDVMKVEELPEQRCLRVTLANGVEDGSFLVDLLMQNGLRLKMFKEEEINLENVFLGITKGITN